MSALDNGKSFMVVVHEPVAETLETLIGEHYETAAAYADIDQLAINQLWRGSPVLYSALTEQMTERKKQAAEREARKQAEQHREQLREGEGQEGGGDFRYVGVGDATSGVTNATGERVGGAGEGAVSAGEAEGPPDDLRRGGAAVPGDGAEPRRGQREAVAAGLQPRERQDADSEAEGRRGAEEVRGGSCRGRTGVGEEDQREILCGTGSVRGAVTVAVNQDEVNHNGQSGTGMPVYRVNARSVKTFFFFLHLSIGSNVLCSVEISAVQIFHCPISVLYNSVCFQVNSDQSDGDTVNIHFEK